MKTQQKNKVFASLVVGLLLVTTVVFPKPAHAGIAAGGVDCAAAAAAGMGINNIGGMVSGAVSNAVSNITQNGLPSGLPDILPSAAPSGVGAKVPTADSDTQKNTQVTASQTTASTAWQTSMKGLADCLVYKAGQLMLDNLTEQTINWIKGGMNGSPHYAVDPHKLYLDLSEAVAGNLARQIRGLELCDFTPNFKNDLANGLLLSSNGGAAQKFKAKIECPFKRTNVTASEFYSGQQKFAWRSFETALNDNGNPFGVAVLTKSELDAAQSKENRMMEQELNQGSGFLGVTDANDCPNMPDEVRTEIDVAKATRANDPNATVDAQGNLLFTPAAISAYERAYCVKTTPPKLIERMLGDAVGTDMQRLGFADNLSKIINALITKMSNDAINGIFKK